MNIAKVSTVFLAIVPLMVNGAIIFNSSQLQEDNTIQNYSSCSLTSIFRKLNPSHLLEGDIMVDTVDGRKAMPATMKTWPDNKVPYLFATGFPSGHKIAIGKGIKMIEDISCVKFEEVTAANAPAHYIKLQNADQGCYSYIGYLAKAAQVVNIGNGCQYDYIVAHELLHAIGFFHEQSRSDRDDNIWVITNNVQANLLYNFDKSETRNFGTTYDYMSVMQYDSSGFSKDEYEKNTMVPKNLKFQYHMGTGEKLSFWDRSIINQLYSCKEQTQSCSVTCNSPGYVDKKCKCQCPDGEAPSTGSCDGLKSKLEANICGGEYTVAGEIKSPNYPSRPSSFKAGTCSYIIKAPAGKKVQAKFVDFEINDKIQSKCRVEHVEVRTNDVKVGTFYCGTELKGKTLTSSGQDLIILSKHFQNSSFNSGKGFHVEFSFVDGAGTTAAPTTTKKPTTTTPTATTGVASSTWSTDEWYTASTSEWFTIV